MTAQHAPASEQPLLSNRFLLKLSGAIGLLALATVSISMAGKFYGARLAQDGYSTSIAPQHIILGDDVLQIPNSMIRFEDQRRSGRAERVDIYLAWPEMTGFSEELAHKFNNSNETGSLLFAQFSQSVMSRDMSGRLEPIYSRLFAGPAEQGPAGLVLHRMKNESGFGDEVLMTASRPGQPDYVVRCILPAAGAPAGDADCQRDVQVGQDISMLYRFSSELLPQWAMIDTKMTDFAKSHVAK